MDYYMSTLSNGMKIVFHDVPYIKTISSSLWIKHGAQNENVSNNGITHLLEHNLVDILRDSQNKNLYEDFRNSGAKLNATTNKEFMSFNVSTINDKHLFEMAVNVLKAIVQSQLSENVFHHEKEIVRNECTVNSGVSIKQECLYALWDKHSIALPAIGDRKVIEALSFEDLSNFKNQTVHPRNTFIVIVGNFKNSLWPVEIVKDTFESWTPSDKFFKGESVLVKKGPRLNLSVTNDSVVKIALAFNGVNFHNPNSRVLDFTSQLLSAGSNSRLYKNLRQNKKLIYSIDSVNYSFGSTGALITSCQVSEDKFEPFVEQLLFEFSRLKSEMVTEEELEQTKQRYLTKLAIELDRPSSLVGFIGRYYMLGRIFTYSDYRNEVNDINQEHIQRTCNQIITQNNLAFVASGNFNEDFVLDQLSSSFTNYKEN